MCISKLAENPTKPDWSNKWWLRSTHRMSFWSWYNSESHEIFRVLLSMGLSSFSSAQSLSCVRLCNPWTVAHQVSLSITNFWSLFKLTSMELVMPSNHLVLCPDWIFSWWQNGCSSSRLYIYAPLSQRPPANLLSFYWPELRLHSWANPWVQGNAVWWQA